MRTNGRQQFIFIKIKLLVVTVSCAIYATLTGCGAEGDSFFHASLGLNEGRIIVANAVTSPISYSLSLYSLEGEFIKVILDTTVSGAIPRGLAVFDAFNVILSTDTPDQLSKVNIFSGELKNYANSNLLTGNIYDVERQNSNTYFVVETSTIEKFVNQSRAPAAGAAYINTAVGSCTISNARGLTMNSLGDLLVTSFGNGRILRYDVSSTTATCLTSDASIGAQQPIPIVAHANGNIYFGTQVNDAIYVAPEDLSTNPTILISGDGNINNPTAMALLPNGNILVASDGIDTIVEINTAGSIVNSTFIKNAFTGTISDIMVIPPQ